MGSSNSSFSDSNKQFPYSIGFKNEILSFILATSALISLLYLIGIFNRAENKFYFFSGLALTFLISFLINSLLNYKIIPTIISTETWSIWKEVVKRLFFLSIYIFNTIHYINFSIKINFTKVDFVQFIIICSILGVIPIIIKILITKSQFLKIRLKEAEKLNETLAIGLRNEFESNHITITSNIVNETFKVKSNELIYIKSDQNYITIFYYRDSKILSHLFRISLINVLKQVDSIYIARCHRSYIVNLKMIEKVIGSANGLKLKLKNSDKLIPVSRSFKEKFKEKLKNNNLLIR